MARATGDILKPLIEIDRESGCWLWLGKINAGTGYGQKQFDGRTVLAHRWVLQWFKGWIPAEAVVDHLCRNRRCVNPDHLEVTTHTENCRRGRATRLTPEQVLDIRKRLSTARWGDRIKIAADFGISLAAVSDIKHGRAWADIQLGGTSQPPT